MRSFLTVSSIWAESGQIKRTQRLLNMPLRTPRPKRTKSPLKPLTLHPPTLLINMQIQTLISIRAKPISAKEVTLWHLPQIILVQEFAVVAFLAEPAQPVLAYEVVVGTVRVGGGLVGSQSVPVGAGGAEGTVPGKEELALGCVGGDAETVGGAEEGVEVEFVFWWFL